MTPCPSCLGTGHTPLYEPCASCGGLGLEQGQLWHRLGLIYLGMVLALGAAALLVRG